VDPKEFNPSMEMEDTSRLKVRKDSEDPKFEH